MTRNSSRNLPMPLFNSLHINSAVNNCRMLLKPSLTEPLLTAPSTHGIESLTELLLTAASTHGIERRCWSSQQCYLHCLCTGINQLAEISTLYTVCRHFFGGTWVRDVAASLLSEACCWVKQEIGQLCGSTTCLESVLWAACSALKQYKAVTTRTMCSHTDIQTTPLTHHSTYFDILTISEPVMDQVPTLVLICTI